VAPAPGGGIDERPDGRGGARELSSSIIEIGRQVQPGLKPSQARPRGRGRRTDETVSSLIATAQKIGDVVAPDQTTSRANQPPALNATIEAARAGEAGNGLRCGLRGPNRWPIKRRVRLRHKKQIGAIQAQRRPPARRCQHIAGTILELDSIAMAICRAIEEQGAATQEIARNIEQAAAGTGEVSATIAASTPPLARPAPQPAGAGLGRRSPNAVQPAAWRRRDS